MAHNSTIIPMGSTQSSFRDVTNRAGVIEAGCLVRLKSDGTISRLSSDGRPVGVSLGLSLDNTGFTAICLSGIQVPVLLTAEFSPVIGTQVFISDTTGLAIASGAGATGINATYQSNALTAVKENGTSVVAGAAYINMPGGV